MSRFDDDGNWDDEYAQAKANLWAANIRRALNGKRGQATLAELETALLALPEKRLIEGSLCDGTDVCLVGALAIKRHMDGGDDLATALSQMPRDVETAEETAWAGQKLGLSRTLAYHLAYVNDERFWGMTPEGRFEMVLEWVRKERRGKES